MAALRGNWFANSLGKRSLEIADSKREVCRGIPHPGYFAKRGCKLLKTKVTRCKKRAKRLQEIEGSGVRVELREGCERPVRDNTQNDTIDLDVCQ